MTDGDGLFDNNSGQDYTFPVTAGSTWEEWQVSAMERAKKLEEERAAQEAVSFCLWPLSWAVVHLPCQGIGGC